VDENRAQMLENLKLVSHSKPRWVTSWDVETVEDTGGLL
jgi:hypothetical protein